VRLRIDPRAPTAASAQLRDQLAARIEDGRLLPGERLAPTRALAAELGLAANTVAKAYRELESGGYLVGRGRLGTFVVDEPPSAGGDPEAALGPAALAYARRARRLGVPADRAAELVRRALRTPGG
jgi:DNA-binding transcriptional regulator YhcF (GntR family)